MQSTVQAEGSWAVVALGLLAPVVLLAGSRAADETQPRGAYTWLGTAERTPAPETWSLSSLAAIGAEQRWIMTLAWFVVQFFGHGDHYVPAERIVAAAQCVWPLVLALGPVARRPLVRVPSPS